MPPASAPRAVATDPVSVYHANTAVLVRSVTTCESAACSIDRNGPTSPPLGLITPIVPARRSSHQFPVDAKTRPAAVISVAPMISIRRRPIRSARVVSSRETTVSPMSVAVRSRPVCASLKPSPTR